jgi:cysteine desulfurase
MMPIYLDNHATTPMDPVVRDAMLPWLVERFGNPSSKAHSFGRDADDAVARSRAEIAASIGARPDQIILTSGATESINLAIRGIAAVDPRGRSHIVAVATEHKAVLDSVAAVVAAGGSSTIVPVQADGVVDLAALAAAIRADTLMICAMAVNNEIGVLQPVREIGTLCADRGVHFFCDGAQAPGRVALDVNALGITAMSLTAHKCYGPKGAGCLFIRRREVPVQPLIVGGGQEFGLRSGTLPTHQIVGLAASLQRCSELFDDENARLSGLRDRLLAQLSDGITELRVNGSLQHRVGGNLNVSIPCADAATLMMALPGLAISSGSACSSGATKPSHVLSAIGLAPELAYCSLRFGVGRFNTQDEIDQAAQQVVQEVAKLRANSAMWEMRQAGVEVSW